MEKRFFFITRVPDEPGPLQKAASVIRKYSGNINRVHYDRRIDPFTVFFEVTATEEMAGGSPGNSGLRVSSSLPFLRRGSARIPSAA